MTQFTCKGVKQISLNMTFTFTIRISRRFSSAREFQMGEFPEILIAKCRSRFYCTWFFSRAEDFESWREGRKGPSKSGEKCSHRKVHMYANYGHHIFSYELHFFFHLKIWNFSTYSWACDILSWNVWSPSSKFCLPQTLKIFSSKSKRKNCYNTLQIFCSCIYHTRHVILS
jgi:hypothetical protein